MRDQGDHDLTRVGSVWERAASEDPFFAVLSDPDRQGGRWDSDSFFETGPREVETVLAYLGSQGVPAIPDGPALDFGCGLGRLTGPLSVRFDGAVGVDVSSTMLQKARTYHDDLQQVQFVHNERDDLAVFGDDRFAFVYSNIVLQHLPSTLARKYVEEFIRVTLPGGTIVFQLPDELRLGVAGRIRHMIRLRTRLAALQGKTVTPRGGDAVEWEMHGTPERTVRRWIEDAGQSVRAVALTNATDPRFNGELQYLDGPPDRGWVSKQYCVVKDLPGAYV